jgi:L-lysine exporter family protein LysE/ArgO
MFVTGFVLCLSACLDLGVVNVATIKRGLDGGFRAALALSLGSAFGDLAYATLSMFGLTLVLTEPHVRVVFWIGGTIVLLYLAATMIRETRRAPSLAASIETAATSDWRDFLRGLALALSSPSLIVWFASAGGAVIAGIYSRTQSPPYLFLAGFFCCSVVWAVFMALLSGKGRHRLGAGTVRIFSGASAAIFVALAVKVFVSLPFGQ